MTGLNRNRAKGTRLGCPPMETAKVEAIRSMLIGGKSIRETARATGAGTASVQRIRSAMQGEADQTAVAAAA